MTVAKPVRKIKFLKRLLSGSCGARNYKYIKIKCILFRKKAWSIKNDFMGKLGCQGNFRGEEGVGWMLVESMNGLKCKKWPKQWP